MTAAELERLPEDGYRHELVRGELRTMPYRSAEEGLIAGEVGFRLGTFVHEHRLGAVLAAGTGFLLATNPDTVRAPAAAFVSQARLDALPVGPSYRPEAPDLVAEVISPSDNYAEVEEKVIDWLDAGTRLVLVVNARHRTVTAHRSRTDITLLAAADVIDGGDVVPGWTLAVGELFG